MTDADTVARSDALAWAEQMRSYRASLIGEVASGALAVDGLFALPAVDGGVHTIRVVVVAEAVPGVGKVRARRAMEALGIGEDARWGEVDPARLRALWQAMAEAATRPL